MNKQRRSWWRNGTLALAAVVWLAACASTPPAQEMSDARQAIQAARDAGAAEHAPEALARAEALLKTAQKQLELGVYREARAHALEAKTVALDARRRALAGDGPPEP